jgi:hypothetical protein
MPQGINSWFIRSDVLLSPFQSDDSMLRLVALDRGLNSGHYILGGQSFTLWIILFWISFRCLSCLPHLGGPRWSKQSGTVSTKIHSEDAPGNKFLVSFLKRLLLSPNRSLYTGIPHSFSSLVYPPSESKQSAYPPRRTLVSKRHDQSHREDAPEK